MKKKRRVRVRVIPIADACVQCGIRKLHIFPKSNLCDTCAMSHIVNAAYQLHAHEGQYYEKWKAGMARASRRITGKGRES